MWDRLQVSKGRQANTEKNETQYSSRNVVKVNQKKVRLTTGLETSSS